MSYIYLDRKIQDHWLWSEKPFDKARAWIDLLMLADYCAKDTLHKGKIVKRKRGEVHVSLLWLAERWGWSRDKVRRFMRLLESDKMIHLNATRNETTITIENYSKFQDKSPTDNTTDNTTDKASASHIKEKTSKDNKGQVSLSSSDAVRRVFDAYNSVCVSLPRAAVLNKDRKGHISARIQELGEDRVIEAFYKAEASDFLTGRNGEKRKTFNLDWLIGPKNIVKVLEGLYDNHAYSRAMSPNQRAFMEIEQRRIANGYEPVNLD